MTKELKSFGYKPLDIKFSPKSHRYKLGDLYLIGTTTVLGCRRKEFLQWWTVKEMYKFLGEQWNIEKTYTAKEKEELLLLGKKAWTVKKDKALDSGSIAHILVQKSIIAKVRGLDNFWFFQYLPEQTRIEVSNSYQAWLDWEKTHKIEYLVTELVMGSEVHYVGGTVDVVAIVDGQLELIDWKTSSQLSDDVVLQLASYKMMLIEGGVDNGIRRRAVRFDKSGKGFEDYLVESNYEKDLECFLALLRVYRWQRDFKSAYMNKWGKIKIKPQKQLPIK